MRIGKIYKAIKRDVGSESSKPLEKKRKCEEEYNNARKLRCSKSLSAPSPPLAPLEEKLVQNMFALEAYHLEVKNLKDDIVRKNERVSTLEEQVLILKNQLEEQKSISGMMMKHKEQEIIGHMHRKEEEFRLKIEEHVLHMKNQLEEQKRVGEMVMKQKEQDIIRLMHFKDEEQRLKIAEIEKKAVEIVSLKEAEMKAILTREAEKSAGFEHQVAGLTRRLEEQKKAFETVIIQKQNEFQIILSQKEAVMREEYQHHLNHVTELKDAERNGIIASGNYELAELENEKQSLLNENQALQNQCEELKTESQNHRLSFERLVSFSEDQLRRRNIKIQRQEYTISDLEDSLNYQQHLAINQNTHISQISHELNEITEMLWKEGVEGVSVMDMVQGLISSRNQLRYYLRFQNGELPPYSDDEEGKDDAVDELAGLFSEQTIGNDSNLVLGGTLAVDELAGLFSEQTIGSG
jgi:hypothetical protein